MMSISDKISRAEINLQRKLDWVGRHDSKITFVTGILIAMLGVLASSSSKVQIWNVLEYLTFGIAILLLSIGLFYIYRSQYPKIKSSNTSLNYFGTISEMKFDEFRRRTLHLNDEEYLDDLLYQIHINSEILIKKFLYLKISLILLGLAIIPWLAFIYISHEYI